MKFFLNTKNLHTICLLIFIMFVGIFFQSVIAEKKIPAPTDTLVGLYHPWRDLYAGNYPRGIPFKNFLITSGTHTLLLGTHCSEIFNQECCIL